MGFAFFCFFVWYFLFDFGFFLLFGLLLLFFLMDVVMVGFALSDQFFSCSMVLSVKCAFN